MKIVKLLSLGSILKIVQIGSVVFDAVKAVIAIARKKRRASIEPPEVPGKKSEATVNHNEK